ncbi:DUF4142 domain-containing protein [Streptomyces sp. HC44]|uniref:DUF4142 domain-containing protein n=1 Tax=Streptomyces scabichelini TaxID=2711217 RepID=A0A6G4VD58_9ACTN|nr:DUF4142 domain-containing protein [Streptomyces scabichelini]NGO11901.1 DUF4142 domain-containing protein [Streptomyces scabichelini]
MHVKRWAPAALTILALSGISAAPAIADEKSELSTMDYDFLRSAHQGNLAEIAAGQDAQRNATTDCVKKVAATLVRDHTRLDRDGKALADKLGVTLPGTPTAAQQQDLAAIKAKAGTAEYDKAWLNAQQAAHETKLALIDKELASGSNTEVKAAARAARPVVVMHLLMVRGGTCRAESAPAAVHAGSGGQVAAAADREAMFGVAALGAGGVLMVIGWRMAVARRRSTDER